MSDRLTLIVLLYVDPSHEDDYERFEREAARIMATHGGRVERRVSLREESAGGGDAWDVPHEVHVVTFPDEAHLQAYRSDPRLGALADLRARAIRRTVVWRGVEGS